MPLIGLKTEDGATSLRWDEIKLAVHAELFRPADAALIAALIESQKGRAGLPLDGVTASKAGTDVRQLWLEDVTEWYARPSDLLAGLLGTVRHATVLKGHPEFIIEQRFSDELGSAQIDSFHIASGVLSDLKTVGWYKLKMILQNGLESEAEGYLWQMNRQKYLLEGATDYRVTRMILMVCPPDIKGRAVEEAKEMGVEGGLCQIDVPDMGRDATLAYYGKMYEGKALAKLEQDAPWCSKTATWSGKRCQSSRWCPVRDECLRRAQEKGVRHPYLEKPLDKR